MFRRVVPRTGGKVGLYKGCVEVLEHGQEKVMEDC